MIDIEHVDHPLRFVDAVPDSVLTPPSPPLTSEWCPQRSANTVRIVGERTEQELDAGRGYRLGQVLGQLASGGPGHYDPEAHSAGRRFRQQRTDCVLVEDVSALDVAFGAPDSCLCLPVAEQFERGLK